MFSELLKLAWSRSRADWKNIIGPAAVFFLVFAYNIYQAGLATAWMSNLVESILSALAGAFLVFAFWFVRAPYILLRKAREEITELEAEASDRTNSPIALIFDDTSMRDGPNDSVERLSFLSNELDVRRFNYFLGVKNTGTTNLRNVQAQVEIGYLEKFHSHSLYGSLSIRDQSTVKVDVRPGETVYFEVGFCFLHQRPGFTIFGGFEKDPPSWAEPLLPNGLYLSSFGKRPHLLTLQQDVRVVVRADDVSSSAITLLHLTVPRPRFAHWPLPG